MPATFSWFSEILYIKKLACKLISLLFCLHCSSKKDLGEKLKSEEKFELIRNALLNESANPDSLKKMILTVGKLSK